MTSPILLLVRVRLARQRGGRLAKLTNEIAQYLYGYQWMTQPQLLVQTKVQIRQDVISY
jgi:hypothetical protein